MVRLRFQLAYRSKSNIHLSLATQTDGWIDVTAFRFQLFLQFRYLELKTRTLTLSTLLRMQRFHLIKFFQQEVIQATLFPLLQFNPEFLSFFYLAQRSFRYYQVIKSPQMANYPLPAKL